MSLLGIILAKVDGVIYGLAHIAHQDLLALLQDDALLVLVQEEENCLFAFSPPLVQIT